VCLVLAAHFVRDNGSGNWAAAERTAAMGRYGVDLFFVLSGFLITRILIRTKTDPHYFRIFYLRRALRILPLFYGFVVLLLLIPIGWTLEEWLGRSYLAEHQGWFWTYTMNWLMAGEALKGTLPNATDFGFGTFWSLAIEEQFYLVWPLIIIAVPTRYLLKLIGLLAVSGVVASLVLASSGAPLMVLYYSTPTRLTALAVGAMLAALESNRPLSAYSRSWFLATIGCFALLLAGTPVFGRAAHGTSLFFALWLPALAIGFGAMVLGAVASDGLWRNGLQNPVLRYLGRQSYAIYLIQAPVQHILLGVGLGPGQVGSCTFLVLGSGTSVALAWVSWHALEVHFLRLKSRMSWANPGASERPEFAT
jgi:peptidoglycan/LPS O-acetylase OafA/YrhL